MNRSEETWALQLLILEDERALKTLKERERMLDPTGAARGFQAATERKNLLSDIELVEERLRKNRQHLSDLSM